MENGQDLVGCSVCVEFAAGNPLCGRQSLGRLQICDRIIHILDTLQEHIKTPTGDHQRALAFLRAASSSSNKSSTAPVEQTEPRSTVEENLLLLAYQPARMGLSCVQYCNMAR